MPWSETERKTKKPSKRIWTASWYLAEWTGLEPATPGVTGRYSNQLNYHSAVVEHIFLPWTADDAIRRR